MHEMRSSILKIKTVIYIINSRLFLSQQVEYTMAKQSNKLPPVTKQQGLSNCLPITAKNSKAWEKKRSIKLLGDDNKELHSTVSPKLRPSVPLKWLHGKYVL